ncbi:MAG: hypothetical protein AB7H92_16665 [Microbacteriaceae bacterium]
MSDELQIRSFRVVFELERRIYSVDRFRVPLPYGLPLRSLAYAATALLCVLVLDGFPVTGALLGGLPAPVRLVLVPVAASWALTRVRVDGRSAHATATACVGYWLAPRRRAGVRHGGPDGPVVLGDVTIVAPASTGGRMNGGAGL